ncbi:MAG: hypothetical protein AAF962_16470 [Actinomycetota bacterium]
MRKPLRTLTTLALAVGLSLTAMACSDDDSGDTSNTDETPDTGSEITETPEVETEDTEPAESDG